MEWDGWLALRHMRAAISRPVEQPDLTNPHMRAALPARYLNSDC
jgi:hypothetical protein